MTTSSRIAGSSDWTNNSYWTANIATGNDVRVEEGGDNLSSNLTTAHDYTSLYFGQGYTGDVGSDGTSLVCNVDQTGTGVMDYHGSGDKFYHSCTSSSGVVNQLTFAPANGRTVGVFSAGVYTTVYACGGTMIFKGAANPVSLYLLGATVVLEYHASNTPTLLDAATGYLTIQRDFTALKVAGNGKVVFQAKGITGGTVEINGGEFEWLDGSLGAITHRAGRWKYDRLMRSSLSAGNIASYAGAIEVQASGIMTPTLGTRTKYGPGAAIAQGTYGAGDIGGV